MTAVDSLRILCKTISPCVLVVNAYSVGLATVYQKTVCYAFGQSRPRLCHNIIHINRHGMRCWLPPGFFAENACEHHEKPA